MPKQKSLIVSLGRHLMGLVIFGTFAFLLYEYGDKWGAAVISWMIVALLIFAVLVYAPNQLKQILAFLAPVSKGTGDAISQVGKDKPEPPAAPPAV